MKIDACIHKSKTSGFKMSKMDDAKTGKFRTWLQKFTIINKLWFHPNVNLFHQFIQESKLDRPKTDLILVEKVQIF